MRRKRFQRGSLKAKKRRGKLRWYAQWREEGIPRSKELGICSEVTRIAAEAKLQEILKPINEGYGAAREGGTDLRGVYRTGLLPGLRRELERLDEGYGDKPNPVSLGSES